MIHVSISISWSSPRGWRDSRWMGWTMIRSLHATDIVAYVTFWQRIGDRSVDGVASRPQLALRAVPVAANFLGRSLSPAPGRESWIEINHGEITGLVGARRRDDGDIWDIDQLAVLPIAGADRTAARLLDRLLGAAVNEGIHKVFLRLPEEDPAIEWARQAGFYPYCREDLYGRPEVPSFAHRLEVSGLRLRRPADHQPLFQLYCTAVPFRVRQAEGMTLQEWRWLDGWVARRVGVDLVLGSARSDYLVDGEAHPSAWLQVDRRSRRLGVLIDPSRPSNLPDLLRHGLAQLGRGREAWCAVRDYQPGLSSALADLGFCSTGRYVLFSRALAARIPEIKLVPIRAS